MKIVVLDSIKGRNREISELAEKKGHNVKTCFGANDLFTAVEESKPEFYIIDMESWNTCISIIKYTDFVTKMGETPAVIYNAPENFVSLAERDENEADIILSEEVTAEDIVEAI